MLAQEGAVAAACAMAATSNNPWAFNCCMTAMQSKASSMRWSFVEPSSSPKSSFGVFASLMQSEA